MKKLNRKLCQTRPDGYSALRVFHRAGRGKKSPRLLIKCGDCDSKFEIYHDSDREDLEIAGVLASIQNWREILLPLLNPPRNRRYGASAEELDQFVKGANRQISRERRAKKMKRYSGNLEADLAD